MNRNRKGLWVFTLMIVGGLLAAAKTSYAADLTIQDGRFTLHNGAMQVADPSATDGYSARMANNSTGWNIQYENWDFSELEPGQLYDVSVMVKVKHAAANPTGNAFKLGLYDSTSASYVIPEKTVAAAATSDSTWKEYRIGTFKPNASVNDIGIYIAGAANSSQVSDIYVDCIVYRKHQDYLIEDASFVKYNDASTVTDGMAADLSAGRVVNGPGSNWNLQVPIDGTRIEAGKSYRISMLVKPEMTNWTTATGDVFGYTVYDFTSNTYLINPTIVHSSALPKLLFYQNIVTAPIAPNPSHDVKICFYKVDNAANYPAFQVDSVTLAQDPSDELPHSSMQAYPYKISPADANGLNDVAKLTYTLSSSQTVSVNIYRASDHSLIRTLVSGVLQSGMNTVVWDGKNNSGQTVPNGLYTAAVSAGSADLFRTNVQVITGVSLTPAANTAKDAIPKGIFYEGLAIPNDSAGANAYLNATFGDIRQLGADTVFMANWDSKPAHVYASTLAKASANGLKIVGLPDYTSLFNEALYNDETAMYDQIGRLINPYTNSNALYGYYLRDEPENDAKLADNLKDMKRMLETLDPSRPVLMTYVGVDRVEMHYNEQKPQAMNIDPYGVTEGSGLGDFRNIYHLPGFSYESYMDFASLQPRKDIADPAPLWTILQTHNNAGWLRDPTAAEIRAMTYEAIGHGSKGFTYFMYQTEVDWEGLVDANYQRRADYYTVQALFSEIETLKPTIRNMRRTANVAAASGGGNAAYASADVTTHVDSQTGDKYLVVVNHDVTQPATMTLTIDRSQLGMDITAVQNVLDNANVAFATSGSSYTISGLPLEAGNGVILRLVKDPSLTIVEGQSASFTLYNNATNNHTDVSASDGFTAKQTITTTRGWNIQWTWNPAQLAPGATYDLYAVVKVKYAADTYVDGNGQTRFFAPSGMAFSYGVYDATTSTYPVPETTMPASQLDNMFWHTVKIGSFVPSLTHDQTVFIMPWDNPSQLKELYVDKFYMIKR
ncbi:hypothetical protein J4772_34560 [Cohnella sp. LGH]|uniref:FlgD immunoglobulin-like domain containing protein n=1 Tax=Cohnella sp. LGH TaxID=1619153 RepID=UPI001ADCE763|nr:FlgD immunoglobulin-like domain containing protein [Cohnella sp. LGH]QTH42525.1 hypothetical protein J4772_34560 [Cohnella sp. LGH]